MTDMEPEAVTDPDTGIVYFPDDQPRSTPNAGDVEGIERWADDHFTQGEVVVVMRLVEEFGWRPPAEARRAAGERIALPTNYALRCASCGDKATTTVVLEGFRTPVCLRHYNVWHTPEFDAHMCGIACERCR